MASINPGTHTHTEHVERRYRVSSPADAEGTVASSSKINEPFRRSVRCRTRLHALREWRIPLLMTDGRAITGMTADSRARARAPTRSLSPDISRIFLSRNFNFSGSNDDRESVVVFEIECAQISRCRNILPLPSAETTAALLFSPCIYDPRSTLFTSVWLLTLFPARLSNNRSVVCPYSFRSLFSPRFPLRLSFLCFFFSPSDRPHRRRVALSSGYSTFGNTYLHREVVCARAARRYRLEFQFLDGQNVSTFYSTAQLPQSIVVARRRVAGRSSFCAAAKLKRADHYLSVPINATPVYKRSSV